MCAKSRQEIELLQLPLSRRVSSVSCDLLVVSCCLLPSADCLALLGLVQFEGFNSEALHHSLDVQHNAERNVVVCSIERGAKTCAIWASSGRCSSTLMSWSPSFRWRTWPSRLKCCPRTKIWHSATTCSTVCPEGGCFVSPTHHQISSVWQCPGHKLAPWRSTQAPRNIF